MNINAIILAAGKGTRMKSEKPKVLHEVLYEPMIVHVIRALQSIGVDNIIAVIGYGAEQVKEALTGWPVTIALQQEQLGTGHAVMCCRDLLKDKDGLTLVLNGDAPLIQGETLKKLVDTHVQAGNAATFMTCELSAESSFGRMVRDEHGNICQVVEFKDCTPEQKAITEMNAGEYCFDNQILLENINKLNDDNAQHEYYLTDLAKILSDQGLRVGSYVVDDFAEVGGVNDRVELANANRLLRRRVNKAHMLQGVTIVDPDTTYIGTQVKIGQDTIIEPGCILSGDTVIGRQCQIGPYTRLINTIVSDDVIITYSQLSDSQVERGTDIGPFARLRTNCHIMENVHIGNFVEMKKTTFGKGSKAAHLSYIGDATVGANVNIGCGTITSNYDGANKFQTILEDDVFVGCNTNLVAPVKVGKGAFVAAGSTVTEDVASDALAIARARQVNKDGYAKVLEERRLKIKKAKEEK